MRIWRYVVLAGGIVGVLGFFAPFLELRAPDGTLTGASAFELARGDVDVSALLAQAQRLGLIAADEAARVTKLLSQALAAYRTAMTACFVPAALLALVGLVAFARRKLGRLGGLLCVVAGVAAIGVWIFFFQAPDPARPMTAQLGLGLYALALGGLLGLLGGLGALIAPE